MTSENQSSPRTLTDDRHGAVISDDGTYRYRLWRTWDTSKPVLAFVLLNPSTADATTDDPTLRRCQGYAEQWGYGRVELVNLFALRSTDPDQLYEHDNPVGPENNQYLQDVCEDADKVIVAWGNHGTLDGRGDTVTELLDTDLYALDVTNQEQPTHPLYQPRDTDLELFEKKCND
jgi:hypothetical protein